MEITNGFDPEAISRAVHLLRTGDVVAFPTETVYGLGADALNPYAVARIFEVKKRPTFDPLIVHVGEKEWLAGIALTVPPVLVELAARFWPGPLTIIVPKQEKVPGIITAGLSTVAVRMPSHPVARSLLSSFGGPVAAPSANPFGYLSPTKAAHVAAMLGRAVPLILDGGDCHFGIESTIVSAKGDRVFVHRHGAIGLEELLAVTPDVVERRERAGEDPREAPGDLPFHYAPLRPLRIVGSVREAGNPRSSFLAWRTPAAPPPSRHVRVLSPDGDPREAAARFFSCLIELDSEDVDIIYAERIPLAGLGRAMMERLEKAARRHPPGTVDNGRKA